MFPPLPLLSFSQLFFIFDCLHIVLYGFTKNSLHFYPKILNGVQKTVIHIENYFIRSWTWFSGPITLFPIRFSYLIIVFSSLFFFFFLIFFSLFLYKTTITCYKSSCLSLFKHFQTLLFYLMLWNIFFLCKFRCKLVKIVIAKSLKKIFTWRSVAKLWKEKHWEWSLQWVRVWEQTQLHQHKCWPLITLHPAIFSEIGELCRYI